MWVIFDRVQRGLPVGAFRFAPRADIPRRYQREAARGVGWTEKGHRHCGAQLLGAAAVVEAGRMAAP
jgi:hypothetical protein